MADYDRRVLEKGAVDGGAEGKLRLAYKLKSEGDFLAARIGFDDVFAASSDPIQQNQALEGWLSSGPLSEDSPHSGFLRTYLLHRGKDDLHRVTHVIDWEKEHYNPHNSKDPIFTQNQLLEEMARFRQKNKPFVFPDSAEEFSLAHTIKLARDYFGANLPDDVRTLETLAKDILISPWEMTLGYAEWDKQRMTHCRGREDEHKGGVIIPGESGRISQDGTNYDNRRARTAAAITKADQPEHIHTATQPLLKTGKHPYAWIATTQGKRAVLLGRGSIFYDFGIDAGCGPVSDGRPARRVVVRSAKKNLHRK